MSCHEEITEGEAGKEQYKLLLRWRVRRCEDELGELAERIAAQNHVHDSAPKGVVRPLKAFVLACPCVGIEILQASIPQAAVDSDVTSEVIRWTLVT